MSQSPPSYTDGISVKISERFKPPPKIKLPQSVINRLMQFDGNGTSRSSSSYNFELEETVLRRITEWRAVKEKKQCERSERLRLKEQEVTRRIEAEHKHKLNQISYPNTDDLSSGSDGGDDVSEENGESPHSGSSEERSEQDRTTALASTTIGQYSYVNNFDTILIPTVLPDMMKTDASVERIASTEKQINFDIPKCTTLLNNNNNNGYNKINYSDFENDTSSPFDNMELKTINDLDILAQVLNLNVSDPERSHEKSIAVKSSHAVVRNRVDPPAMEQSAVVEQQVNSTHPQYQQTSYQIQQVAPSTNDYYKSFDGYQYSYGQYAPTSTTLTASYTPTDGRRLDQYNLGANTAFQPGTQFQPYHQGVGVSSYNFYPYANSTGSATNQSTYANTYHYSSGFGSQLHSTVSSASYNNYSSQYPTATVDVLSHSEEPSTMRSKSKSVPDIVRQLDEEVQNSAQRRTRNNSQSADERRKDEAATSDKSVTSSEYSVTTLNQFSQDDQNLVKRVSSMGFPLERVVAVLKRIGSDDKKVVEHLIPLTELIDLGFDEEKISDALIKFDNNKHKALDYLIS
ncbi:uncharacterized protein LOC129776261 [Toxorhynchites rutilus septentrionalis]|uniref:uncharacterized protein LOC129776261 n=1 Tax=Toxorhynchites rutilus septentrionalis TaxID=329112 RepID=UPI00247A5ABE|nr:uncharacterized protein LOC129776261 [Toxorhynchites rutilus septentrionalis]XP_055637781.1 uncharacterized protein LOC129776261 [Toxorhynchites rutilus septentrionalis]